MNNVLLEKDLYPYMCVWLQQRLEDRFKNENCSIIVEDVSTINLDTALNTYGVLEYYPNIVGLGIQIDVLGIVKWQHKASLFFIEAKKTHLNLHDLGQLWAYCKLCDPDEAFLLSSAGLGSLSKILNNLKRTDLLSFGEGKIIKYMQVGKWDTTRNTVDNNSLIPKI